MNHFILIIISFIVALLLTALPLPAPAYFFMPDWVGLVLIFWILHKPDTVRFLAIFLMGLACDILMGAPLGLHPFAYLCGLFPAIRWRNEFLDQTDLIQPFLVFGMLMTARIAMLGAWLVVSQTMVSIWFFLPPVIAALLWLVFDRFFSDNLNAEMY
ncbi:MAG: rod shape-determining protein MreD [Neisseriaceae bacterium]|nr:rod shape-determining protein MreD [Neisseriaceae bacterium]MBR5676413.1 rod shape-determining protein MreD [Neisseriaceae bacterium]MBR5941339.1 rod shape-determining protein MreD [Neisseriaceae bacterium]